MRYRPPGPLRLPILSVLLMWTRAGSALGAPMPGPSAFSSSELVIVEGGRCRVTMTKVSYDDPGADDAELIELHVDVFDRASGPSMRGGSTSADGAAESCGSPEPTVIDAGAIDRSDAARPAARHDAGGLLTLGSCGLAELRLI